MMDPLEYDALGEKARAMTLTTDEFDRLTAESERRCDALTAYVDKELLAKPLGKCGGCGHSEVLVNPIPAQMSAVVFCASCQATRKVWSNIGEPE